MFRAAVFALLVSGFVSAETNTEALQQQIETLQKQLDQIKLEKTSSSAEKPSLPISINYRQAYLGQGLVALMRTTNGQKIPVMATLSNPALGTSKQYELHLSGIATKLGYAQGFILENGDTITLENANYAKSVFTVQY